MKGRTKSVLIFAIIFALVATVVFGGGLYYVISKGNSLIVLRQTIADHTAKEHSYNFIQNLEAETEEERAELQTFFLHDNEQDTLRFINELETLGRLLGVSLKTNSLDIKVATPPTNTNNNNASTTPVVTDPYDRLQISLEIEGSAEAVRRYVTMLENLPYDKNLHKISLRRDAEKNNVWVGTVELSLTLLP